LQWANVRIMEDFPKTMFKGLPTAAQFIETTDDREALADEEANLLYVACTRATTNLHLNEDLHDLVRWARV
jgi:ATP-dependent exoDNAse (exonuclease V) beta subunit